MNSIVLALLVFGLLLMGGFFIFLIWICLVSAKKSDEIKDIAFQNYLNSECITSGSAVKHE